MTFVVDWALNNNDLSIYVTTATFGASVDPIKILLRHYSQIWCVGSIQNKAQATSVTAANFGASVTYKKHTIMLRH